MSKAVQAIRGMNDILPEEIGYWQFVESQLRAMTQAFAYREIRFPIVEMTALFKRTIGDVTDIVEKEMYTFEDRNGDSLSLRPEGTAACVRAAIQNGLLHNQSQGLWYLGPMFRHERPQKGRYRQFHQFGLEVFGYESADVDVEVLQFAYALWGKLGLQDSIHLEINSIGSKACRQRYNEALVRFLQAHIDQLDDDSKARLDKNPLRILDSKVKETQHLLQDAPVITDYLDDDSKAHFARVCTLLDALKIPYQVNHKLVRGLDYYNDTVFEWVTDALGAQGTVCAGGRYDGLVDVLGGKASPAVGFALGMERLIELVRTQAQLADPAKTPDIYFIATSEAARLEVLKLSQQLRDSWPSAMIVSRSTSLKLKNQMKQADKLRAEYAVIIGEDELNEQVVTVKSLQAKSEQVRVPFAEVTSYFLNLQTSE